mmetsp:Transcript_111828/g.316638  ORF Transcript_111828/g.316638 Transcript_111828/m.316638 type:complete len:407 (+) Transcript_111828:996-2216(+)
MRVGQHLVRVGQLLELGLGLAVARILVGVALPRFAVVGFLDVRRRRRRLHLQQVVELGVRDVGLAGAPSALRGLVVVGALELHLMLEGAQVDVDPLAELLVPDPLVHAPPHGLRRVGDAAADLRDATRGAADGDRGAAEDAGAEPLDHPEAALLVALDGGGDDAADSDDEAGARSFQASRETVQGVLGARLGEELADGLGRVLVLLGAASRCPRRGECGAVDWHDGWRWLRRRLLGVLRGWRRARGGAPVAAGGRRGHVPGEAREDLELDHSEGAHGGRDPGAPRGVRHVLLVLHERRRPVELRLQVRRGLARVAREGGGLEPGVRERHRKVDVVLGVVHPPDDAGGAPQLRGLELNDRQRFRGDPRRAVCLPLAGAHPLAVEAEAMLRAIRDFHEHSVLHGLNAV